MRQCRNRSQIFRKKKGVVATRLLAARLAGIRDYRLLGPFRNESFAAVQAGLVILRDDQLVAPPGERFHYSTYGYSLSGAVMESAAKQDLLDYRQEDVFTSPTMMSHVARPCRCGGSKPNGILQTQPVRAVSSRKADRFQH